MTARGPVAVAVLLAGLGLGVLADVLLRVTPWGLNLTVCALSMAAIVGGLAWWQRGQTGNLTLWLALPSFVFALAAAWRDSPALKALDVSALLVIGALTALSPVSGVGYQRSATARPWVSSVTDYAIAAVVAGGNAMAASAALLWEDVPWRSVRTTAWLRHGLAIGRGLAVSLPLVLLFGGLFMAADAAFQGIVLDLVAIDGQQLLVHGVIIATLAWMAAGFLRGVALETGFQVPGTGFKIGGPEMGARAFERGTWSPAGGWGIVETSIVLGLLDLLFLGFVIVQFRYFFGGAGHVEASAGLTYAEYVRRGFFELVTVAALVLPLLLVMHWLLAPVRRTQVWVFRLLAGALVLLLFVVMASAAQRMRLYQRQYGLTELRLYTTAFMGWLAVLFVWFVLTVLRDRRERFAVGALAAGLVAIIALHALNPDALIVRTNTARVAEGREFDARYALSLSADAVPALVKALPNLAPADQCRIASDLLIRWSPPARRDWRTWSRGRAEAWTAVGGEAESLRRYADCAG